MNNTNNWSVWLPNLNSWISAIIVALVTFLLTYLGSLIWPWINLLINLWPRVGIVVWFLAYISPIFALALGHHYLNLLLDKYFPDSGSTDMIKVEGYIPGLVSWWQGMYGWVVVLLSMTISNVISAFIFAPYSSVEQILNWSSPVIAIPLLPLIIRCLSAAYLYHFQTLVWQRLQLDS